jgi:hypothetical protein
MFYKSCESADSPLGVVEKAELLMASSSSLEVLQEEEEVEREVLPARATSLRFSSALPSPISTSRVGRHLLYRAGTRLAQKKTKTTKTT